MPAARIQIDGRLTADPELAFTPSGQARCRLSVAANEHKKNQSGEWEQVSASFFDVTVWGDKAEALAGAAQKGTTLLIVGKLVQREYTDRQGEKRRAWDVTADQVAVVPRADSTNTAPRQAPAAGADPWATSDEAPF